MILKKVQKCLLMCLYFVPAVSDRDPEEGAEMHPAHPMCLYFVPAVSDRDPEEGAEMPTHVPMLCACRV